MKYSLDAIFNLLKDSPDTNNTDDLFGYTEKTQDHAGSCTAKAFGSEVSRARHYDKKELDLISSYFRRGFNISHFNENARHLFELSPNAFDTFIHAWMSELPVETQMLSFGRSVIAAAQKAGGSQVQKRRAAEKAAVDRSDENTCIIHEAAYKTGHEIHRIMGLLRFSPDKTGTFIAHCSPDHLVIPALGEYFTARFGETSWIIIDEKRHLFLSRQYGLTNDPPCAGNFAAEDDEWEELWKHYHKTINNESRKNPNLQRQLMPKRYWKYLPEV